MLKVSIAAKCFLTRRILILGMCLFIKKKNNQVKSSQIALIWGTEPLEPAKFKQILECFAVGWTKASSSQNQGLSFGGWLAGFSICFLEHTGGHIANKKSERTVGANNCSIYANSFFNPDTLCASKYVNLILLVAPLNFLLIKYPAPAAGGSSPAYLFSSSQYIQNSLWPLNCCITWCAECK